MKGIIQSGGQTAYLHCRGFSSCCLYSNSFQPSLVKPGLTFLRFSLYIPSSPCRLSPNSKPTIHWCAMSARLFFLLHHKRNFRSLSLFVTFNDPSTHHINVLDTLSLPGCGGYRVLAIRKFLTYSFIFKLWNLQVPNGDWPWSLDSEKAWTRAEPCEQAEFAVPISS